MAELLNNSSFIAVILTIGSYELGVLLKKKFKSPLINPLFIAILISIAVIKLSQLEYASYNAGARHVSFLMTPVTICLAVPLYEKFELLKQNYLAIIIGIFSGVVASFMSIFLLSLIFRLGHSEYATLMPKSITTAIAIVVAEEYGGIPAITATAVVITGVSGTIIAEPLLKFFSIKDPIAIGIGLGSSAHALGTTKAMEFGETEGAMSSLSIAVAGIFTVLLAPIFGYLI